MANSYCANMATDYLYPLEQTGLKYVVHGRAARPEVMAAEAALGEHSSFLVSTNVAAIKPGDRIWFRAGVPEQRIVAVGVVQAAPYQGIGDDRWRIVVALDSAASRRLQQARRQPSVRAVRRAVWKATAHEAAELRKITGL